MAQLERNSESFKHAKSPHSIAFDQLIQERAKKLRHSLSGGKKKHENHVPGETNSTRPAWGANLEENEYENEDEYDEYDEEDDDDDDDVVEDEDPEYLGAPMYESELAPEDYKETARQHPRADPLFSEKSVFPLQAATKPGNEKEAGEERSNATEPQPSSSSIDSKFSGLTVAATAAKTEEKDKEGISSPTRWDKGVSVKEYLMNKLEPGEDERELSKVISEAMSPRTRAPGDRGVVEKVKDAVSSFLRPQPPPINQFLSRVAAATNHTEVSPSQGSVSATNGNSSPLIPVSTNAHEVVEEESEGRTLQTN
ncbi:unnamed protein product [Cuscuta campestris]|uniref:LTI65/LTI78 PGEED repeat domain-containing protein n=1 Tax=Cuscuta campestris TaxID=132261 RepID=A0A484MWG1_9ASTE|nr:unnamed protein product [Cuscuta campestris]